MSDLSLALITGLTAASVFFVLALPIVQPYRVRRFGADGWAWLVTIWTQLFTDELAKDDQHVPVHRDADEILIAARTADVFDLAAEKNRRRLAAMLTEECGALTGPAWTFHPREK